MDNDFDGFDNETVRYEVWQQVGGFAPKKHRRDGYLCHTAAAADAADLNVHWAKYARPEAMKVRYYVVEATTKRVIV